DSGQVIRAGGELTTNGLLDIRASEWTNSSVLQAGRLNLDSGTFRETAEGELLAMQSFTGRGGDWSDDGVLESANQDLDLQLGSLANAGGRILHTGNGTFGLDSGQVIRAGGELTTNGLLDIRASEWTNSSVLQAGR
ncbi:hypothetical protein, partial [Pseudomonas aeruginosa]|uniref:hypothetical protein n=1 Tax=Pseudomonas aeruginosa TaxID=287 RepID=UPI001E45A776